MVNVNVFFLFSCFSEDFGKTFKHVNAEVFNMHIRKDSGILKSPVDPNKVSNSLILCLYISLLIMAELK